MPPGDTSNPSQQTDTPTPVPQAVSGLAPQPNVPADSQPQAAWPGAQASPAVLGQPPTGSSARKSKKTLLVVVAAATAVVLAAASGGAWWWNAQRNAPEKVFTAAIAKLLTTATITQTISVGGTTDTMAYDGTDVKNPKVSSAVSIKADDLTYKINGHGDLKNEYLKYKSFGSNDIDNVLDGLVDEWVRVRTDGKLDAAADADLAAMADPRYMVFGDVLVGNFSGADQRKFMDYITTNKIYAYNAKDVTTTTIHGHKTYVYAVTENVPKLKELNKKFAALMHVPAEDIQPALDQLGTSGTTKLYIDVKTKQIVHYTAVQDGETVSGGYSDYGTTSLPKEPESAMTWSEFEQKQSDISDTLSATGGTTTDSGISASQQI